MKNQFFKLLIGIFIICSAGCQPDACKDVTCLNGGACNDGTCICPTGFTGTYCETTVIIDPCDGVLCLNGGTCVDGTCDCPPGFTGANCETVVTQTLPLGTYNVTESCTSGNFAYSIAITAGSGGNQILISNFGDYTVTVVGTVSGTSITIPNQTVGGGTFSGSGTINGSVVIINYTVTAGSSSDSCTMTCT